MKRDKRASGAIALCTSGRFFGEGFLPMGRLRCLCTIGLRLHSERRSSRQTSTPPAATALISNGLRSVELLRFKTGGRS